jgi:cardiolipin synthase
MKAKNIPNILSGFRILLVFVFAYLFFWDYPDNLILSLCIFLLAGLTDIIDGYLARKNNWISDIGKLLDPFADKLMQCTVLVCLAIKELLPIWLPVCYLAKELAMVIGSFFLLKRHSVVTSSRWFGKLAVCVFYASVFALIVLRDFFEATPGARDIVSILMLGSALAAIISYFVEYFIRRLKTDSRERTPAGDGDN